MADATDLIPIPPPPPPPRVHPVRQRLMDDMALRGFSHATQQNYTRYIRRCIAHTGKSPAALTVDDAREFLLHLQRNGASVSSLNQCSVAMRFFLRVTLAKPFGLDRVPVIAEATRVPVVLTQDEVARLLAAAPGFKYRAALSVAYGAGLRAAEVVQLKVSDIDAAQMAIRVEQGKGAKDRFAKLSPALLTLLREWWLTCRSPVWLFPSRTGVLRHITPRQFSRGCMAAAQAAKIGKRVTLHTLRHSFATHLLEAGVDIRVIQVMLGHSKLETTAIYTRVSAKMIEAVDSPFDSLPRGSLGDGAAPA
jgi:site-specific recombinase XerD